MWANGRKLRAKPDVDWNIASNDFEDVEMWALLKQIRAEGPMRWYIASKMDENELNWWWKPKIKEK